MGSSAMVIPGSSVTRATKIVTLKRFVLLKTYKTAVDSYQKVDEDNSPELYT